MTCQDWRVKTDAGSGVERKKIRKFCFWCSVAVLLLLGFFYTKTEVSLAGNESTRFGVIQAVVDQGVFYFNNTAFRSVDRVVLDGKVYSDKPLLPAMVGAAVYKAVQVLTGINFSDHYHLAIYLVNLLMFTTINLLIFILFWRKVMPMRGALFLKVTAAFFLCAGTWIFSYSVTMNNHTPTALLLLLWFLLLDDFGRSQTLSLVFLAGIVTGAAANCEIPPGALAGLVGLPVVWTLAKPEVRRRAMTLYIVAGAAMVLFFVGLNYAAYGTPVPLYISGGSGTFTPGTGMKFYPEYFGEALFGRRGVFSYQPFALFAIPFLVGWGWRKLRPAERGAAAAGSATIIFYLVMTNEYGGWAYGFRYLIPVLPLFWYLALRFLLPRCRTWRSMAPLLILMLWGAVTAFAGAYEPFCAIHEGYRSKPGNVVHKVRNSFTANLLSRSFRSNPEGPLAQFMLYRFYGERLGLPYLALSYENAKDIEGLKLFRAYLMAHPPLQSGR